MSKQFVCKSCFSRLNLHQVVVGNFEETLKIMTPFLFLGKRLIRLFDSGKTGKRASVKAAQDVVRKSSVSKNMGFFIKIKWCFFNFTLYQAKCQQLLQNG